MGGNGLDSFGSGYRPPARPCEHGNETSVSFKCGARRGGVVLE
jgi:hypothetical protein